MQMKTEAGKAHEIKNPAINFGVYGQDAKRLGDIVVTSKGLVWSNGRKSSKDITVKWSAFIDWMQSQSQRGAKMPASKAAAKTTKTARATTASKSKTARTARAGTGLTRASTRLAASSKRAPARKTASKINGRAGTTSKVPTIASPKEKTANKTAH
jgi:hypothetical protein